MKNRKGFTLIEILAVLIIIGIITMIVIPNVTGYIADTRNSAYHAHERTMEESAKSMTVECIAGRENCNLPKDNNTEEVYLSELQDKEFVQRLQDPGGEGFCSESLSYVRITNTGKGNYEYHACLYCQNYHTNDDNCKLIESQSTDTTPPTCGAVTGESSEWTKGSRTITVACSDNAGGSGCMRDKFTRTFSQTTDMGEIEIVDKAGRTRRCPVSVKVDNTPPTCTLITSGDSYGGGVFAGSVTISFGNKDDAHSKLDVFGIGTSITPSYNNESSITVSSGITTVIGYVKDNAGNEGVCTSTIESVIADPDFSILYGYQIYPNKEVPVISGNKLTFNNMEKYKNVRRVIITLNANTSTPGDYKLNVSGGPVIRPPSGIYDEDNHKRVLMAFSKGTYSTYEFNLPAASDLSKITRIELEMDQSNLMTRHNVTVNLIPNPATEIVKTTKFSFDGGSNYQALYYKPFTPKSTSQKGYGKTGNDIPRYSKTKEYIVGPGDTTAPTITALSANPTAWTNGNVTLTGKAKDTQSGIIAFAFSTSSNLAYDSRDWRSITNTKNEISKTKTVEVNKTYYFYVKDEAGNVAKESIQVSNIDKLTPTCSWSDSTRKVTAADPAATTDYGQSKLAGYAFTTSSTVPATLTTANNAASINPAVTISAAGTYYLYVKDNAGNLCKGNDSGYKYHKVTFDSNGGSTVAAQYVLDGQKATKPTNPTRTGFTFVEWQLNNSAYSFNSTVTSNITLKAKWKLNTPGSVTITGGATKIYGASDTKLTCATTTSYPTGTTLYYSFGYASTDGGAPGSWTANSTTNTYTVSKTAYVGSRYYSCRIYAVNGEYTSETGTSPTSGDQLVKIRNAKITFNVNGGTISGTSPLYTKTGVSGLYTGEVNTTAATVPGATLTGATFNGWYTAASGGSQIYDASKNLKNVSGYTSGGKWTITEDKTLNAHWTLTTPATVTISGGATKVYGSSDTTLTCATTTTYGSGITLYYSFGYSTTDGGAPGNWTNVTTTNTYKVTKTAYVGSRYYSCRIYAKMGDLTSGTGTSPTSGDQLVKYRNAKITFNVNGGTISGSSTLYTKTGASGLYTGEVNTTAATVPGASMTGYIFAGWYTAASGGSQIYDGSKNLKNVSGYTASNKWTITSDITLYAQWTLTTPAAVTISGGDTKIYGSSNISLSCSTTTTYGSGITLNYSFGYSTTDGGTPGNWTSDSASSTYSVPNTAYVGSRYYSCRVIAKKGSVSSAYGTSPASGDKLAKYRNAKITFNTDGGTIHGSSTLYTRSGSSSLYTGEVNSTTATVPSASKSGYFFLGWFTDSGGQIYDESGRLMNVTNFTNGGKYTITSDKTFTAGWKKACNGGDTYDASTGKCVNTYNASVGYRCPSGTTQSNNRCYYITNPSCPNNSYTRSGFTCTYSYNSSSSYGCPGGTAEYSATECVETSPVSSCETGYSPSGPNGIICTNSYNASCSYPDGSCKWTALQSSAYIADVSSCSGYTYAGQNCTDGSADVCFAVCGFPPGDGGYKCIGGSYLCNPNSCSNGVDWSVSHAPLRLDFRCTCSGNKTCSCPSGGTLNGESCSITKYACNPGWLPDTVNGNCYRTSSKITIHTCPSGGDLQPDNTCKITTTATCPNNYSPDGNVCSREVSKESYYYCNTGDSLNESTGKCTHTYTP